MKIYILLSNIQTTKANLVKNQYIKNSQKTHAVRQKSIQCSGKHAAYSAL